MRRMMALFVVLLVTLVLLLQTDYGGATARKRMSVSNQTPLKTIHARNGDIIDCVDINKQPAFDDPLLKNHKIQMKPSFIRKKNTSEHSEIVVANAKFELQDCPQGTVPILRMFRRKQHSEPNGDIQPTPLIDLVRHYEVLETDDGNVHYGVKGMINVNDPVVEKDQWTSVQIWVQSGPQEDLNIIEAGWFVYPPFYGDYVPRLYTSWSGIGSGRKNCINYLCLNSSSGFVQIDQQYVLGNTFLDVSVYGGAIFVLDLEIARDPQSGNWWLTFADNITLGYWPKEMFNHLGNSATKAGFGAVTGAPAKRPSPPMGNGHFPDVDLSKCSFIGRMKVIDINGKENNVPADRVRVAGDKPPCYEQGFKGYVDDNFQFTTSFGGPGGSCGCFLCAYQTKRKRKNQLHIVSSNHI